MLLLLLLDISPPDRETFLHHEFALLAIYNSTLPNHFMSTPKKHLMSTPKKTILCPHQRRPCWYFAQQQLLMPHYLQLKVSTGKSWGVKATREESYCSSRLLTFQNCCSTGVPLHTSFKFLLYPVWSFNQLKIVIRHKVLKECRLDLKRKKQVHWNIGGANMIDIS